MWERHSRIAEDDNLVITSTELARVFNQVTEGTATVTRLHAAVREYVDLLRIAGLPPEKVVIAVKRGLGFDELGYRLTLPVHVPIISRAVTECIRRYYGVSPQYPSATK
jgi:hypothetical protein